jgi:peptidyl-prolyl cis-trans isomerase C
MNSRKPKPGCQVSGVKCPVRTPRTLQIALRLSLLVGCSLLAWLPLGCSRAPRATVLATVGDHQITADDFRNEMQRRHAARRPIPDKAILLQEMVLAEAMVQRARAAGLLDDPQVRHEINTLLASKLQDRELAPRLEAINPSADEVKAEYERNLAKYTRPAKVRLAVLALAADPKMSDTNRRALHSRMVEARNKSRAQANSKDFGPLAIEYSDDQASRYRGGDLGWLDAGNFNYRWPREVLETGYTLEPNLVSEVIETASGFYLVMKTDSRPGSTVALAEVEAALRQSLAAKQRRAVELAFRESAVRDAQTTLNTEALATVEMQLPPLASAQSREPQPPAFPLGGEGKRQ